jgi:hypothetical protein
MPYSTVNHTLSRAFRSIGEYYFAGGASVSSFDLSLDPTEIVGFYEDRNGHNSAPSDLIQVFGPSAFRKVVKTVTVGFDFKTLKKDVYYRDARGRLRYKVKTYTKRVPRKVRTIHFVKLKVDSLPVADRSKFLKPNFLSYKRGYSFQAPRTLMVSSDVGNQFGESFRSRTVHSISGPGGFFCPYDPMYPGPADNFYSVGVALANPPSNVFNNPELEQQAMKKLFDKVSSSLPDYFLSAAESPKTIDLLKSVLIEAAKLAKMIYRLKIREIAGTFMKKGSSLKTLSDYWLAWWYGIMPTVYDIEDTISFLSEKERLWRSYTASAKYESIIKTSPILGVGNISGEQVDIYRNTVKLGVIVEGRLGFNDYLIKASKPLDNAALIYELIPLSFVLDWIIDIGSYLSGLEVLEDKEYYAWHTDIVEQSNYTVGKFVNNQYTPTRKHSSSPFVAGFSSISLRRVPISSFPESRFPRVAKPVVSSSWIKRSVTALALDVQLLHSSFNKRDLKSLSNLKL